MVASCLPHEPLWGFWIVHVMCYSAMPPLWRPPFSFEVIFSFVFLSLSYPSSGVQMLFFFSQTPFLQFFLLVTLINRWLWILSLTSPAPGESLQEKTERSEQLVGICSVGFFSSKFIAQWIPSYIMRNMNRIKIVPIQQVKQGCLEAIVVTVKRQ